MEHTLAFTGEQYVQCALASMVFIYGGSPFLNGLVDELKKFEPGVMTLIAPAILTACGYSSLVVFGWEGRVFFWELATLIDIMLLSAPDPETESEPRAQKAHEQKQDQEKSKHAHDG